MLQRLVRINAGGRRFEALATTLMRHERSALASVVASHLRAVSRPPLEAGVERRNASTGDGDDRALQALPQVPEGMEGLPKEVQSRCMTAVDADGTPALFLDVDPAAFESVLSFLRTSEPRLPTDSEAARANVVWQLRLWGLLHEAFPAVPTGTSTRAAQPDEAAGAATSGGDGEGGAADGGEEGRDLVVLPDMLVVQTCDHLQHEMGVKRHAMTLSFGADGFRLKDMCRAMRKDLKGLLSSAHWQMYQTHERAAFFVCSRINNGTADLMTTSVSQRLVDHVEKMGYTLASSYVTLSPDAKHLSVRLMVHNYIFRRTRLPVLEDDDLATAAPPMGEHDRAEGDDDDDVDVKRQLGGGVGFDGFPDDDAADLGRSAPPRPFAAAGTTTGRQQAPRDEYVPAGYGYAEGDAEARDAMYRNFEPPSLGPQRTPPPATTVPRAQRVAKLWPDS
jgi:hypothetical protein